ncbi:MAG: hypothetical protein ACYC21_13850 [Eubacteriales bacterium]
MEKYFIYPVYTGILGSIAAIMVPRQHMRRLAALAIVFGGAFDVAAILLLTKLLGVGGYLNFGPFGFIGIPLFPPIAWTIFFLMYFYILPDKKPWVYIFPFISAIFSIIFSNVLLNLGIFEWNYGRLVVPFLIYISWHSSVTWAYLKTTNNKYKTKDVYPNYWRISNPALLKRFYHPDKRKK